MAEKTIVNNDKIDAEKPWKQQAVPAALRKVRTALSKGEINHQEYKRVQRDLLANEAAPAKSYTSLMRYLPRKSPGRPLPAEQADSVISGFPAADDEDKYLGAMDSYLTGDAEKSRAPPLGRAGDRVSEREKEIQFNNPVSVYNWLRKNHPQVFLQDNEASTEKANARPAASRTKRASAVKQDPELYDEDGIAVEAARNAKGNKRKRDEDGGYRPKGGNGRASKRKREETSGSSKKSKKKSSSG